MVILIFPALETAFGLLTEMVIFCIAKVFFTSSVTFSATVSIRLNEFVETNSVIVWHNLS